MAPETLIFSYTLLLLAGISILALYSEFHRRQFRGEGSEDRIFRCEKCGIVYTDDSDVDRSRCWQCGTMNEAIEF